MHRLQEFWQCRVADFIRQQPTSTADCVLRDNLRPVRRHILGGSEGLSYFKRADHAGRLACQPCVIAAARHVVRHYVVSPCDVSHLRRFVLMQRSGMLVAAVEEGDGKCLIVEAL